MRYGILTSGGDCPGLNAVLRAVVRRAEKVHSDEVIGFIDAEEVKEAFDLGYHLKHVDTIFTRVFGG